MEAACLGLLATSAMICREPFAAQYIVSSHVPQSIAVYLEANGFQATLTKDGAGDPMIESAADGTRFKIIFHDCKAHAQCESLRFSASFVTTPSVEIVNEWNAHHRFGQAYLTDQETPVLDLNVMMVEGALPYETFDQRVQEWTTALGEFRKYITGPTN